MTKNRIEQWLDKVSKRGGYMEQEDACFLMVQSRHLIEESKNFSLYRITNFYSDWMVHQMLDRSELCLEMLRDITKVLADNWGETDKDITVEISKIIGLSQLKSNLINLFNDYCLPVGIFNIAENWQGLAGIIVSFLINKPISFPQKNISRRAKEIKDEMITMPKPANFWVESLIIVDVGGSPHWCVQLDGDKKVKIMGLLSIQ